MEFTIREIHNGVIIKFDFGYFESKDGDYYEDIEVWAPDIKTGLEWCANRLLFVSETIHVEEPEPIPVDENWEQDKDADQEALNF